MPFYPFRRQQRTAPSQQNSLAKPKATATLIPDAQLACCKEETFAYVERSASEEEIEEILRSSSFF